MGSELFSWLEKVIFSSFLGDIRKESLVNRNELGGRKCFDPSVGLRRSIGLRKAVSLGGQWVWFDCKLLKEKDTQLGGEAKRAFIWDLIKWHNDCSLESETSLKWSDERPYPKRIRKTQAVWMVLVIVLMKLRDKGCIKNKVSSKVWMQRESLLFIYQAASTWDVQGLWIALAAYYTVSSNFSRPWSYTNL